MINGKVIFDSEDYTIEDEDILKDLFDNKNENNTYILVGSCGCYDGPEYRVFEKTFDSVYEAITHTFLRSYFTFKVISYPYGVLYVETHHHDGVNDFEIRQLSNKGYDLYQHWWEIGEIVKRKGTTKNAHFKLK